ncbi:hypothetical protein SUGI_1076300 [Cryptomeria japonica]|nr:hypothetical protein SUGI_1076300 [Cryptomeria japonica]
MAPSIIKSLIEEINEREEEHKITGIIVDAMTCFGLKAVADFYKIPLFAFHASIVANCAIRYFIPRLVSLGTLAQDVVFGVIEGAPKEEKKVRYIPSMHLESNKDGIIEKGEIVRAVDRLLVGEDGAEIRKHVSKLMRSSRDVVKEGGSSFNNYSKFLYQMKK